MFDGMDWGIVVQSVAGAAAVYAAIRADLAYMKARVELALESTKGAHERIDKILEK